MHIRNLTALSVVRSSLTKRFTSPVGVWSANWTQPPEKSALGPNSDAVVHGTSNPLLAATAGGTEANGDHGHALRSCRGPRRLRHQHRRRFGAAVTTLKALVLRPIVREPLRTILTLLGIAVGVAVVVAIELSNQSALRAFRESVDAVAGRANYQIVSDTPNRRSAAVALAAAVGSPASASRR